MSETAAIPQDQDKTAELIGRLEDTPPGRAGADDCWQAAAALQAQQAEIARLRSLLQVQTFWVEGCLENFGPWDGDQRAAAHETCDLSRAALAEPKS